MPHGSSAINEAYIGLRRTPRSLPHHLMYDENGIAHFQAIKQTAGYYQARVETSLLEMASLEIGKKFAGTVTFVDYGASSVEKALPFLTSIQPVDYVAVDISPDALLSIEEKLNRQLPNHGIKVFTREHDFRLPLMLPAGTRGQIRVGLCAGQTLGNFEPEEFLQCLEEMRVTLGEGSFLLVGMDIVVNGDILMNAYSDQEGMAAKFATNLLTRLNREGGANFEIDKFEYLAAWEKEQSRIAMYLVSRIEQKVRFAGEEFYFHAGEKIHLANSYKYPVDEFTRQARKVGWQRTKVWTDDQNRCAVYLLKAGRRPCSSDDVSL